MAGNNDEKYMMRCLCLARKGSRSAAPNPMVGAVLVCGERIIGEGWHRQYGTAHAEVNCFASVSKADEPLIEQSTLYVSLEPCSHYGKTPPCADLVVRKHPRRVVVGMTDPNPLVAGRGIKKIREAGIEVTLGVLEHECRELNKRFLCLQQHHRPYVTLKWAQTADGYLDNRTKTTPASPLLISNAVTKILVHKMRAENMAILVGANTALMDNPRLLTTRWTGRNPLRCVIDSRNTLPADAMLRSDDAETLVFNTLPDMRTHAAEAWTTILDTLAARGIHSLIVEGGAVTLHSLISCGLWDEAQVEVSNVALGTGAQGTRAPVIPTDEQHICASSQKLFNHTLLHYTHKA